MAQAPELPKPRATNRNATSKCPSPPSSEPRNFKPVTITEPNTSAQRNFCYSSLPGMAPAPMRALLLNPRMVLAREGVQADASTAQAEAVGCAVSSVLLQRL